MRALGYRRDAFDARDHLLAVPSVATPPAANVGRLVLSTLDQLPLGSCVLQSVAQNIRCAHVRAGITSPTLISRLLAYFAARAATGDTASDTGTEVRTALKQLGKVGFAPETAWPYDIARFAELPPPNVWRLAYDQSGMVAGVSPHYARIATSGEGLVASLRHAIASELPVSFGCDVSKRFTENDGTDTLVEPPTSEPIAGGHAELVVAYRTEADGSTSFQVLNSWGDDFGVEDNGMKGTSWWSERYFTWNGRCADGALAQAPSDFWVVDSAPYFSSLEVA